MSTWAYLRDMDMKAKLGFGNGWTKNISFSVIS